MISIICGIILCNKILYNNTKTVFTNSIHQRYKETCNIEAFVSVWKASTADLMVSRENVKTQATSNASNETPRFGA